MIKETAKKKYYRKITEPLPQELSKAVKEGKLSDDLIQYLSLFLAALGICLIFLAGYVFVNYENAQDEKRRVVDSYLYWKDVVRSHPNLTDAYYNAGLYSVQLGKNDEARKYLNKAVELDPDFTKAKELEKRIGE